MKRPRFRVQLWLLVGMTLLSICVYGRHLVSRSEDFTIKAREHDQVLNVVAERASKPDNGRPLSPAQMESLNRAIQYHERLRQKYSYAAGHPWISVPPDPPEPE